MEEKQINRYLRRRFSPLGWWLVAYYVLMTIMVLVSVIQEVLIGYLRAFGEGNFLFLPGMNAIAGNAWGYVAAAGVALLVMLAMKGGEHFRQEIMAKGQSMTAGRFVMLLCLCSGCQFANSIWIGILEWILNRFGLSALAMLEEVSGASDTFSMFLYSALLAPILEEIFFRGYILRELRPYGKRFAILGSAFLFGIFHGNLLQTPYAFLIGLVLGYITVEYSVLWAMALHLFNNLVLADLLSRVMSRLPVPVADGLSVLIFGGFFLGAVGILIAKRREIGEYIHGEWVDRRCVKCFFTSPGVVILTLMMAGSMISLLFA